MLNNTVTNIPSGWWCGQNSSTPNFNTSTTNFYDNKNNVSLDDIVDSDLELNTNIPNLSNSELKWTVATGYNGVFITYADLVLPETKSYDLIIKAMGDVKISVGSSVNDLKEVVRHKGLVKNPSYDITNEDTIFTVNAVAGDKIVIKIEMSSVADGANQRVEFELGRIVDGSVVAIANDYWYGNYTVPKEAIHYTYSAYNIESFYSTTGTISSYTSIDENLNIIYQTGKLDDKFLTTPNSDSQSMDPGSIVIYKYDKEVTANYFSLISSNDGDGILSFFEIYVSDNGVDWIEAFKGLCDYESTCALSLKSTFSFKYVKLVFLSQYSGNYINICNFEFQLRSEDLTVIDCPNNLSYIGNTNVVTSAANLNNNIVEFDNKIKFSVTGSTILLFANTSSKYGEVEIKVNGVIYNVDLSGSNVNSKQILSLIDLEYGTYEIEITAINGLGNIDYIAVK